MLVAALSLFGALIHASAQADGTTPGIRMIAIEENQIRFQLDGDGRGVMLVEFAFSQPADDASAGEVVWQGKLEQTAVHLLRMNGQADRLFRKWRLFESETDEPVGSQRFVSDFSKLPVQPHPFPWPERIKGITCPIDVGDLRELGVRHIYTHDSALWVQPAILPTTPAEAAPPASGPATAVVSPAPDALLRRSLGLGGRFETRLYPGRIQLDSRLCLG